MLLDNYITPNWHAPKNIKAFTTKRIGGVSTAPYNSFNFNIHTGDEQNNVAANRKKLKEDLVLPTDPFWLKQEHTNIVINLNINTKITNPIADASFTVVPNLVCAVLTADCVPILICDHAGTMVAAIHAGWRGILNNVIESTIAAMPVKSENLIAWLGPAIGINYFEVDENIMGLFIKHNSIAKEAFINRNNSIFADIYLLASQRLNNKGITNIYGGEYCTFTQKEKFFSFRRDGANSGRMASLIWLTA
jgi:polyphenol oxidase